ncbi:OLC1v1033239C3 [Oldenlandia corymbosa var. corymbosa]|uniref:OLC1v1033239C3 n=1 Tax=Oldenlandia corymbosa var. corymbosa TaxID=529605 RepID=A0AAV1CNR1_OLDCO|nr:OLC1v1033239C3 [Oldenlandia corymbosa var. corymbosa]
MGKSSKKSAPKVDAAPPVSVTPSKPMKKGKREAEELLEKEVSVKKQKKGVVEEVVMKKAEVKKKIESSSSDDSSSDSEMEEPPKTTATKPVEIPKKPQLSATKNGAAKKGKPASSSDSDDSDTTSDSDSDEAPSKPAAAAKDVPKAASKKKSDSSESESEDDSDDDSDDAKKLPAPGKNGPVTAKKDESDSSSEDESSSSEDEKAPVKGTKNGAQAGVKKTVESSDDESSSDEEDAPSGAAKGAVIANKKDESSDDETSDSDDETPAKVPAKRPSKATEIKVEEESSDEDSSDEESEEEPQKKKTKVVAKTEKKESSSEDESGDESSDDEPKKKADEKKVSKESSSEESSSEDSEESSSEDDEPSKTPQKKDSDVDMVDAFSKKGPSSEKKEPKTPAQPQASGSKTLFVGNLSFNVQKSDVEDFFKNCGEVVDVRLATNQDGAFKGFGHVEFATAEAAQRALNELNGQELLGRGLRLDIAAERGSYTPQSGKERNSFQKGFGSQGKATAYVRGFDTSAEENEVWCFSFFCPFAFILSIVLSSGDSLQIKGALRAHFESCGEITRISLPRGDDGFKGIAYIDFSSRDSLEKAIEFDNQPLNDSPLTVQEAKPRDNAGYGGGRFQNSHDGKGRFGSGGRGGGRGRFGNGGRGDGRGRGGRNNYSKPSIISAGM